MTDKCRSCGAPIRWAQTEKGRRIPLDAKAVAGGNIRLESIPGRADPLAVVTPPEGVENIRFVAHFATCPNARRPRKRGRRDLAAEGRGS